MSLIFQSTILLIASLFFNLASTKPIPNTTPNLNPLEIRRPAPVSATAFSDWATNVVMLGGSQEFGMWIPPDGTWYDLSKIQCLDLPAYAIGACTSTTIDQIGVAAGNGPCSFVGSRGWTETISGAPGQGYFTVGPPQTIILAACG